ncbi:L-threonylcarbamoyladenylate synthase [Pectinatus cerevisiiphilus]|uniref:Threonylcarbamoyl-AMP synthase n=1 Tax=Pectinatus cerevisiiphilus TaxID=86956 RepID=A0A4R3K715_9FIRM|nr:L-threonylcarbamoyladenylate synthase [Pectinatus cerevisiiphilus]TCS78724.1 L-threonylcarbamoyladenylate synthase [Pectinatus cerevisiiphilus]
METEIIKVTPEDNEAIEKAAGLIKSGEVVAFPTETVYGLGANGLDTQASAKIYRAKGRPSDNPLILHIDSVEMLSMVTKKMPPMAVKILSAFCPGPVTMIVPKKETIPDTITGGLSTVGVRMPANPIARKLINLSGVPIAAPSANISGRPSPTTAASVYRDMKGRIPLILDGGAAGFGVESTIIDCTEEVPVILRPGAVTKEMLEEIFAEVRIDPALTKKDEIPKAPGMKYRHYAPKAPLVLFEGKKEAMLGALAKALKKYQGEGQKVGIIASSEVIKALAYDAVYDYGSNKNLYAIASNLYNALLYFDDKDIDIILAEGTTQKGIGLAIMNRLKKASGQNIIKI